MKEKQCKMGEGNSKGVWKWRRWVRFGDGGGGSNGGIAEERES